MRALIAAGILLALAGCSDNPPSRAYLAFSDQLESGTLTARYRAALDQPEFAPLRGRVNLSETFKQQELPACEHTSLDGYPTSAEQAALRRWAELRTAYFNGIYSLQVSAAESVKDSAPAARRYEAALSDGLRLTTEAISDLAEGRMTYCQFARRDKALIYYSKGRALRLRDDMEAAMTGFGPGELSIYGPAGTAPKGFQ